MSPSHSLFQFLKREVLVSEHEVFHRTLRDTLVGSCDSVLDIGCGSGSPLKKISHLFSRTVGVDGYPASIERSRAAGIHQEYHCMDLLEVGKHFAPKSFDAVIALDVIEHFEKPEGYRLLEMMESLARKRVVIFTPNGFLPQDEWDNNVHQVHRSGWEVYDFELRGYRVTGMSGWKPLRGDFALPRLRPARLGSRLSILTEPFATRFPQHAFQLLAVRDLEAS
ncbi:class I SAM-dependent methyltransferase [Myxococcus llanfairpwllgwyngyllgogerychwyrndrobwllllantysiliogogogochensis]|uniref:Class I SAM-dependent methyltransferase n=1 Tax=Myxococcus llanfairpwllgwyngyllgogerychwyrndrobwllllantysiliogogogochensis TaxID=2590453 RepID=A0A540X5S1_9BACT|nr:class I SAM-dependent methyltransferase [Myxococcus llanfairpwllgwyngyllgogerychwyrndrobwllllantysiliogogogochensis]TQF16597.1 class I SAM-dependent methyltransferase [Myxococcus llanfairpwllgwyngyllgogerychwyrndrobwllllantysiliogogogochensis]